MNLDEYAQGGEREYAELAKVVAFVLESAIQTNPHLSIHPQAIQHRAKAAASLAKKLEARGLLDSEDIGSLLKDLAGCRVVLYTNNDVAALINSGVISDTFDVQWDESKVHNPVDDQDPRYVANHYVVKLTEQRLALPEFARFRGMKCEIQVHTILNHAWSETSHDILYKSPELDSQFGQKALAAIKARLESIMTDLLMPAGYEFQKVQHDYERLVAGKDLLDRDVLREIETCEDNNRRHELLERFNTYVLPHYDDVTGILPELLSVLRAAFRSSATTEVAPISTPFGSLPGRTSTQVLDIILQIVDRVRYVDVDQTLAALVDLHAAATSEDQAKRIIASVKLLAQNELRVWEKVGPFVQEQLLLNVESLTKDERLKRQDIVVAICSEILKPEIAGSTASFDAVTFERATAPHSSILEDLRRRAMETLFSLYECTESVDDKRQVLSALGNAYTLPSAGKAQKALTLCVLRNAQGITSFCIRVASDERLEIVQHLEHRLFWLYRHNQSWKSHEDPELAAEGSRLIELIEDFRDLVNSNDEYVRYKTLVGYESIFPPAWEAGEYDHSRDEEYRKQRLDEYLESIDESSANQWHSILATCAGVETRDGATFPTLHAFLKDLARAKPSIVFGFLEDLDQHLTPFLPAMLCGLRESEMEEAATELVERWIKEDNHLGQVANHFRLRKETRNDLLALALEKAIESSNVVAAIEVVATIFHAAIDRSDDPLVVNVLIPGLRYLTREGDTRWVDLAWYLDNETSVLTTLTPEQADVVFENLLHLPRIDYHAESVLLPLAVKYPDAVLSFFEDRVVNGVGDSGTGSFEAVPYDLGRLSAPLRVDTSAVVRQIFESFRNHPERHRRFGSALLSKIYPEFPDVLSAELISVLRSNPEEAIDFIIPVLRQYQGEQTMHELIREVVNLLPEDDPRLNELHTCLDSTGVVSGEFGMVEALKAKKKLIETWLADERESVCLFAEKHLASLDREIRADQRRSKEDLELRRRQYESLGELGRQEDGEDQSEGDD